MIIMIKMISMIDLVAIIGIPRKTLQKKFDKDEKSLFLTGNKLETRQGGRK